MNLNESVDSFTPWLGFHNTTSEDDSYPSKIFLSISLGICMVLSVIGNICIFAVIVRDRSMWTPTNYYLANLAVTDLLTGFFIPLGLYIIWLPKSYPFGEIVCRMHFALWDCLSNCSLLIITAFTIERYIVVTKPFLRQKMELISRVKRIVVTAWVISLSFCWPYVFYIEWLERKEYVYCYFTPSTFVSVLLLTEILIFFVFPMTTIIVLYVLIAIELKAKQNKLHGNPLNVKQNKDKAVIMLAAIAGSFFFFWSPYVVLRLMIIYPNIKYEDNYILWKVVNYLGYNGYLSTAANPILYSLMSLKFRKAFKDLVKGRRILARTRNRQKPYTINSTVYRESCV